MKIKGYTLIEIIFILTIIVILIAVASPRWPSNIVNVNAQAQLLASDIRFTQNLAMTHGQRYHLVLSSPDPKSYQIFNNIGTLVQLPYFDTRATLGQNISFGNITNLPNNLINFDTDGTPYIDIVYPGGTALTANATIQIISGSSSATIIISPQTGRVLVP